jgi:predicted GNAT family acetyltransferase
MLTQQEDSDPILSGRLEDETVEGAYLEYEITLTRESMRITAGDLPKSLSMRSTASSASVLDIQHVFVPPEYRGCGVAEVLARKAFGLARQHGWKVRPSCSYIRETFIPRLKLTNVEGSIHRGEKFHQQSSGGDSAEAKEPAKDLPGFCDDPIGPLDVESLLEFKYTAVGIALNNYRKSLLKITIKELHSLLNTASESPTTQTVDMRYTVVDDAGASVQAADSKGSSSIIGSKRKRMSKIDIVDELVHMYTQEHFQQAIP